MPDTTPRWPLIPGAILASGWARRMGRSKALLPAGPGGSSFVRTLTTALQRGGIDDVLVIGRPDDLPLQAEVSSLGAGVRFVENHHAEQGQISSIVAAVDAVDHPGVEGLLVIPVDQPLIDSATVAALLSAFARARPAIVRPTHHGRHGHPVMFAATLFDALRHADPVTRRAHRRPRERRRGDRRRGARRQCPHRYRRPRGLPAGLRRPAAGVVQKRRGEGSRCVGPAPGSRGVGLALGGLPRVRCRRRACYNHRSSARVWACGAAGSAPEWHSGGHRFDPGQVHHPSDPPANS